MAGKLTDGDRLPIMPEGEEWRPTIGFYGYAVSNKGRVMRTVTGSSARPGQILKLGHDTHGYPMVSLWVRGKRHGVKVHRLVAEAFLGLKPDWAHGVAHYDGTRANNAVENLRWATNSENLMDRVRHGTANRGERHGLAKLTTEIVVEAKRRRRRGEPLTDLAREYGVSYSTIRKAVLGESWSWLK